MGHENKSAFRKLSKTEKKIVRLLEKIDQLAANNDDVNISIFGCGYGLHSEFMLLLDTGERHYNTIEYRKGYIHMDRIAWRSEFIPANGGDPVLTDEYTFIHKTTTK